MASSFRLAGFLPYQLAVLSGRISRDFGRIYCDRFGITIPEWRVIANLSAGEALSVREIHARAEMDKAKVSRAVARLEGAGLVAKSADPRDRRLVALTLTEAGHALMARIEPLARAYEARVLDGLDPADATALRAGVERLLAQMQEPPG